MRKIATTGELREYLCEVLGKTEGGTIGVDVARNLVKLSAQINESLYAEIKIARVQAELTKETAPFGDLPLGVPKGRK